MNKTTAFRLLTTLEERGLVERVGAHQYRSAIRPLKRKKYRLGYCALSSDFSFSRDITEGLTRAAADEKIDMVMLDNKYNSKLAVRNADLLIREKVALVFEHQGDEHVAAVVSSEFVAAGIPMITIHVPHPGATYFGPDNYNAGIMGGRYLGRWAKQTWQGQVDHVILARVAAGGVIRAIAAHRDAGGNQGNPPGYRRLPRAVPERPGALRPKPRSGAEACSMARGRANSGVRNQRSEHDWRHSRF